jgi:putative sugar O-methyltransferase
MQVSDDIELLKLMLLDTKQAPDIYKPSKFWADFEKRSVPELYALGLSDFRRRKNSILSKFGATDFPSYGPIDLRRSRILYNKIVRKLPLWGRFIDFQCSLLNGTLTRKIPVEALKRLYCGFVATQGVNSGAKSIDKFEASLYGNPQDIIEVNNRVYTTSVLECYLRYAYCHNYLDFDSVDLIVELGGGSGKQVEVIKKLHPDICFLLFDIPPQLYVCEQYLKAVFPDSLVSYRDTRDMDSIPGGQKGKIFIVGNWKFPIMEAIKVDLFWNASSFQEMEPEIVANYLRYVNRSADAVFLMQSILGMRVARHQGSRGVLRRTTFEHYKEGLSEFELIDMSPPWLPTGTSLGGYMNSFWRRSWPIPGSSGRAAKPG